MKTKHILTAMVLPTVLAACTADEIVENNNVNLDGVAKLNPITFTVGEGADSRLIFDESGLGNWKWGEEGDQFSAFLVNTGKGTSIIDRLLTNYVYSSEDGYGYTTTSVMNEGTYWFYAPGSQDKKDNDLISFKLPAAQGPTYYKSRAAQLFFTPLYQLAKEDAPENIDLSLANWYGRAVMPIVNSSEEDFTVRQIILTLGAKKEWVVEGEISMTAMNSLGLKYAYVDGVKTPIRNLDNDATNDEDIDGLKKRLAEANDIVVDNAKKKTAPALVLDLGTEGVKVAAGAEHTFTMLVPATEKNVTCEVKLITDKGIVTINSWNDSNYTQNGVQFKHNGIMPMFGFKNANKNQFKSYQVEEGDLTAFGAEYYVTTYGYMMDLINTVNGNLTVYNIGDWVLDARMAETIKESDAEVTFTMPIVVEDEEEKISLTKVNFAKVTIAEGTEVAFGKNTSSDELIVEEGAEASLAETTADDIDNNGTLKVASAATISGTITNNGDLTLTDINPTVNFVNGNVTYANTANTSDFNLTNEKLTLPTADELTGNATLTISADVNLTFIGNKELVKKVNVNNTVYTVKLINNGSIDFGASGANRLDVYGSMENNGTIEGEDYAGILLYGSLENNGDLEPGYLNVTANATLENNGTVAPNDYSINDGTITLSADSKTKILSGSGVVNNDAKAKKLSIDAIADNTVYYTFTTAVSSEDVNALNCEDYKLNKVIFNEKLTIDVDDEYADDVTGNAIHGLRGITTLEFAKGLEIESDVKNQVLAATITDIIINGTNVKFEGSNWENIDGLTTCAVGVAGTTKVTVKAGSKLTIEDMKLIPVGNAAKLEFESLTAAGKTQGKVVNKGAVYTGSNGTVYNETTHAAWWTGAATVAGYYNATTGNIQ